MSLLRFFNFLRRKVLICLKPGLVRLTLAGFVFVWILTYLEAGNNNKGEIFIKREQFEIKAQNGNTVKLINMTSIRKEQTLRDHAVYDPLQLHRKLLVYNICQKRKNISGKVGEIIGYKNGRISYCFVQKAGCTSWAKIFRFLNGEKLFKKSPMDISKYETHYKRMKYLNFFHQDNKEDKLFIENSTRVMTVRDPYSRLWSAYIDKFLLPDFWRTKGIDIIKIVRPNKSVEDLRCGSDVTFPEFISYVVRGKGKVISLGQDKHWLPASSMCDPCVFNPTFIAKQETLSKDMGLILKSVNLNWVLNGTASIDRTEHELIDQTDYVFNIHVHHTHSRCVTKLKLCELMWKAYKLNSYIPYSAPFPYQEFNQTITKEQFLKLLLGVSRNWVISKSERHKLKRQIMVEAFKTVPPDQLKRLQEIYKDDFLMFDYDKEPKDIFNQ